MAILPGSTIGVVGGGQLGRMFALEARRMGYRVLILDPGENAPAAQVADEQLCAPLDDPDAMRELAERTDVVTLEWENADAEVLRQLTNLAPIRPGPHVLEVAQHRVREKDAARRLGVPTADYRAVQSLADLQDGLARFGTPAVLKTARGGYDGKGQRVIRSTGDAEAAFAALGAGEAELILERWIPFRLEASVICARNPRGQVVSFPVGENIHRNGILDFTLAPARLSPKLQKEAREIGETLMEGLDVIGLLAVELFVDENDRLLVNEIAPRPHNSGHYTWEACSVSQFELQLRAVCDLPLPSPELLRPACMANLLGEEIGTGAGLAGIADALQAPAVTLHLYGKESARTGRKMGHLTALGESAEAAYHRAREAKEILVASFRAANPSGS